MRVLLILLFLIPFSGFAQINRSAKELASESIQHYVEEKLFAKKEYKPITFGELKSIGDRRSTIVWSIAHKFEIAEGGTSSFEQGSKVKKIYTFLFFLDDKMKVRKSESWFSR